MAELREQHPCHVEEALGEPENKTIRLMELYQESSITTLQTMSMTTYVSISELFHS